MITETEKRLGLLAVENRLITKSQLAKAFWKREKEHPQRPLYEELVDMGLLSPGQADELNRLLCQFQKKKERTEEKKFAERLLEQGHVSREQLDEMLNFKFWLAGKGIHRYLGDILVERAGVPPTAVVALLREQGKRIVACEPCGDQYNCPSNETFTCPECGRELLEVAEPKNVAVKASLRHSKQPNFETGVRIGPCELRDVISRGPNSSLYRAVHSGLQREVAIKLLPLRGRNAVLSRRFFENARRMTSIVNPNIAHVLDSGTRGTTFYMVRALVDGVSLGELIRNGGRLPHFEAVELLRQIALGLNAVHSGGLIHGNLKAENVLITQAMEAVLTDGGLGRDFPDVVNNDLEYLGGAVLTLAPEQWLGRKIDHRADLYAAGILLHFMLTGVHPFEGLEPEEIRRRHLRVVPPSVRNVVADTPQALLDILERLLQKDPAKRTGTAQALIDDLKRFEQGKPLVTPAKRSGSDPQRFAAGKGYHHAPDRI